MSTPIGAIEDAGDALRQEPQRADRELGGDALTVRRDAARHPEKVPDLLAA